MPKSTTRRFSDWASMVLFSGTCIGILAWYYSIASVESRLARQIAELEEIDDVLRIAQSETDATQLSLGALDAEEQRMLAEIQRACLLSESIDQFPVQQGEHIVISEQEGGNDYSILMYIPEGRHEFVFSVGLCTTDRHDDTTFDSEQLAQAIPPPPDSRCQFDFKPSIGNEKTLIQVSLKDVQGKILYADEREFGNLRFGGGHSNRPFPHQLIYYPGQFQPRIQSYPSIRFTRMLQEHRLQLFSKNKDESHRGLMFRYSLRSPEEPLFLHARDMHQMPVHSRSLKIGIDDMLSPDDGQGRYLLKQKLLDQFREAPEFDF